VEGYRYLVTFQLSEVIYQLTLGFLWRFLGGRENLRLREQMEHAARSGKQNIVEGYSQKTSLKDYIKLTGIAKGSLEELKLDYEDFLKRRDLEIWPKEHSKIREFRDFRVRILGKNKDEFLLNIPKLPNLPNEAANLMITLISQATYLLHRQIKALEEKHMKEGGFTEKLYKNRSVFRSKIYKLNLKILAKFPLKN
jgi:four helix bundle suffix protein